MQVNVLEAKSQLSKLVKAALEGEEVIIGRNGEPKGQTGSDEQALSRATIRACECRLINQRRPQRQSETGGTKHRLRSHLALAISRAESLVRMDTRKGVHRCFA